jgi:hypothetical protein
MDLIVLYVIGDNTPLSSEYRNVHINRLREVIVEILTQSVHPPTIYIYSNGFIIKFNHEDGLAKHVIIHNERSLLRPRSGHS